MSSLSWGDICKHHTAVATATVLPAGANGGDGGDEEEDDDADDNANDDGAWRAALREPRARARRK